MLVSGATVLSRIEHEMQKIGTDPHAWLVLTGNRLVVASILTGLFTLGVLFLQYAGVVGVTNTTQMLYMFQGLVAGNLTLVTIVVSINQLVLSREFNTPGELHTQIQRVIDYRDRVEETTHRTTVPSTPADFLSVLIDGARMSAQRFGGIVKGADHDRLTADVEVLVSGVTSHTDHISGILENSQKGVFNALAVTLETNYSHQLNDAYRIQTVYEDDLSAPAQELLDELIESLQQIDIARQYFKSLYMQAELARLSRILLYVGVAAVGGGIYLLLIYASSAEPPANYTFLRVAVPIVVVLGFAPLAILFSFILRISMVAQRTVAITPFTTSTEEQVDGNWEG